jgi:hypothetical protein
LLFPPGTGRGIGAGNRLKRSDIVMIMGSSDR